MTNNTAPPAIDRRTVARALDEVSRYLEFSDANKFKALAFRNAARRMEDVQTDMRTFVESGEVDRTPGIGKAIGPMIVELVTTGALRYLDDLRAQYPSGILDLVRIPGLGTRKIGQLYEQLGIGSVDELETACRESRLASLAGFGKKTEQKILEGIEFLKRQSERFLLPRAIEAAEALERDLNVLDGVAQVMVSGAVRRRLEVVTRIDLCVSAKAPASAARAAIEGGILEQDSIDENGMLTGIARFGIPAFVSFCKPPELISTLFISTGSEAFVTAVRMRAERKGFSLTDKALESGGKKVALGSEHALFSRLGLAFVPPELRESAEPLELERAIQLIEPEDLQGTFHVHTTYSDGRATLHDMLASARDRGFAYVGISDHSKTAAYAGGLTEDRVEEQRAEIESLRASFPSMRIFHGTECDILPSGEMDYGPETLSRFDFVIASVHSQFKTPRDEMTDRIVRAIHNPHVTFLGHLTGRLLLSREGYSVEFDRIFDEAAKSGVMIEINGNPRRLDLDWRLMQRAIDRGVIFSINPDAHSTGELGNILPGIWAARKGGVGLRHIFNTLPVEEVEAHFKRRHAAAATEAGPRARA
ncbi:MAG TPA: DNA polymerase/3'-5' exonuclease PolX [Thermoanaerobaculia bacterium]|nr:DNA polymerase/3'-5' exonuclease PolX [Thermoanaerobaculia bacterium]